MEQTTVIANGQRLRVPVLSDLASFRRWVVSEEIPRAARLSYFQGQVWVDLSMEQLFWHNRLKAVILAVLEYLVAAADLGELFVDGARLSNIAGDWSTEPDGMFVSYRALQEQGARLVPGQDEGFEEVEGSPDWVLEIVSASSEEKDLQILREQIGRAHV